MGQQMNVSSEISFLAWLLLENEPIAEPTTEEVAAYLFLKDSLGK